MLKLKNLELFDLIIIGAGPAGLTAAKEAQKYKKRILVLEAEDVVGGISQTVKRNGWHFDIGGHRFFTKSERVNEFWDSSLDEQDFLLRPRLSRIFYKGKFFDYPLKLWNALFGLGIVEAIRCVLSYVLTQVKKPKDQSNFEGWVAARFGWRLYRIFFKTYTEKVWGIDASLIQSSWAAQRIKSLSLPKAILNSIPIRRNSSKKLITTLIDEFKYPKFGPGMLWEKVAKDFEAAGGRLHFDSKVTSIDRDSDNYRIYCGDRAYLALDVINTMPLSYLPAALNCENLLVKKAAAGLNFRDFLIVALIYEQKDLFPDNWIYIHDPRVNVGRIQNFGNWSEFMVKEGHSCLGLEYFVNENDALWNMNDNDLIDLAQLEISSLGLVSLKFKEGYVVRVKKAYPVYDESYEKNVLLIREWLESVWPDIQTVGRNGMHRYNNQDHSMLTAMQAVDNLYLGARNDLWMVNLDDEYHEEKSNSSTERSAPGLINSKVKE
jgi:protoporphyrinogen oxidase